MLRFEGCFVVIDTAKVLWRLCHIVAEASKECRKSIFCGYVLRLELFFSIRSTAGRMLNLHRLFSACLNLRPISAMAGGVPVCEIFCFPPAGWLLHGPAPMVFPAREKR